MYTDLSQGLFELIDVDPRSSFCSNHPPFISIFFICVDQRSSVVQTFGAPRLHPASTFIHGSCEFSAASSICVDQRSSVVQTFGAPRLNPAIYLHPWSSMVL
jgi:hypothetical protein